MFERVQNRKQPIKIWILSTKIALFLLQMDKIQVKTGSTQYKSDHLPHERNWKQEVIDKACYISRPNKRWIQNVWDLTFEIVESSETKSKQDDLSLEGQQRGSTLAILPQSLTFSVQNYSDTQLATQLVQTSFMELTNSTVNKTIRF